MTTVAVNPEQLAAIQAPGAVFVSAGAGTGKTTVLVERYVRALCERGLSVDSVVVITYTERAAGELKERIRARLRELGRRDLARDIDRAWISTIHGFCSRLLRANAFDAGLDPRFRVLDESQARVLRVEAFREALAQFVAGEGEERLRLLATYGSQGLRTMLIGTFERLRSAGRPLELGGGAATDVEACIADVRGAAGELLADQHAGEGLREVGERTLELVRPGAPAETLLDLSDLEVPRRGPDAERADALADALGELERAALDELAASDRALLEDLLRRFEAAYRSAKERESALDFEDLQLQARELLTRVEAVRDRIRFRFRAIMVDEFQDTNRLQCELIDLVAGDDLFFVGDEFQSIYRFRHADVEVFRDRRAKTGGVLALTRNYRSRPELLDVVNHLFAAEFGSSFQPLEAAARFADPLFEPAVEVLLTDKRACREQDVPWRRSEVRHVAKRVRELVESGQYVPGEIVLLFAAGTNAERYEEALREQGLPTYRATGRGYFGQQQVVDLLAYLRLLHNRYDDEALVTVLASPLVGVSNDALVLLRQAAGRRPLFSGLEREPPAFVSARDRRLIVAFRQRYDRLSRVAPQVGLERLCERIVTEHDYDLAILARWDGRRRYANLRKLARLAGSYEELRGPDIEGFVRFVRDQEAAGAREMEAVAEEEGADAVRLLTIHAAKGLQFKVVVVCDAGRTAGRPSPDEILCLPDGRFGFRVADPVTGKRRPALGYEELQQVEQASDAEEARRLYYVAMTRAIDRLIIAGALDPGRSDAARSPIGWVLARLGSPPDAEGPRAVDVGGSTVVLRVDRGEAEASLPPPPLAEQLELFAPTEQGQAGPAFHLPSLEPVPEPPPVRIRRLSYSALELFARCSYRFYAERLVGLAPVEPARGEGLVGLDPAEIGDAVHGLLELGAAAAEARARLVERYPLATEADAVRVETLVGAWESSPTARRLATLDGVRAELPFAFEHDGVLVHGRFDLFQRTGSRGLVVDYKTNRLEGELPAAIVEREYRLQRLVYAMAALRSGVDEVDVEYVFLERAHEPVTATFSGTRLPELESELSELIATIEAGEFRPTPGELVCRECPVLGRVCAGPARAGLGDGEPEPAAPQASVA
jgi:ATP-dependent exoDNAse (exonuclease V) beta subunit